MVLKTIKITKEQEDRLYCNLHNYRQSTGEYKATVTDFFKAMCCFPPSENFRFEGEQ